MINIENYSETIISKDFEKIIKESKKVYKYLLFEDNYIKLYQNIFYNLDYDFILEIPILYIIYCKVLRYNNKIIKFKEVILDYKKIKFHDKSTKNEISFESNILFLEASLEKSTQSIKKLEKAIDKISNFSDYLLLSEIYFELGFNYDSFYKIDKSLINYQKAEYYMLNESSTLDNSILNQYIMLFRVKLEIANISLLKNRLNDYAQKMNEMGLFIQKNRIEDSYLIFYYNSLANLFFYKNDKKSFLEVVEKILFLGEKPNKLSCFQIYIKTARYLLLFNEIEKSRILINKIEKKLSIIIPSQKSRISLYNLNALFYKKTGDINLRNAWFNDISKLLEHKYSSDCFISIFYAFYLLENGEIEKSEKIIKEISIEIYKTDCDLIITRFELLEIAFQYKIGYKNKAILNLKEKLFLFQKEWNIGIFLDSSDIILNMVNKIYKESFNNNILLENKFLEEIISYSNEKFDFNNYLTEKEIEVLKLVEQKKSNKEIANILFLSINTIKTHLKNINEKLKVNTKNDAVIKAKEYFII